MANLTDKSLHKIGVHSPATIPDFDAIYRNYWHRIYSVCLTLTHDPFLAEDLAQDAFVVLLNKYNTFRGDSALYTWFYRIAFNLVLMQKRARRLTETSLDELLAASPDGSQGGDLLAYDDARLQKTPERILMEIAIAALKAESKTALRLKVVEGFSHEEIAKLMGFCTNTSKSRVRRAKQELQVILDRLQAARGVTRRPVLQA